MSSLEALLPDDLEKHVHLNRARLTSYGVLREEIKTYCEYRGHATARNVKQKGSSHPGGDDPMDNGAFGKGNGKQSKGKHGKGKGKGKQGQHGQHGQFKDKSKDKIKDSVECWKCGKRGHYVKSGSESTIGRMQTRYCIVEHNAVNLDTSMNVTT